MSITTSDYLNQLKKDKKQLVDTLIEKEIDADYDATFTELVPKVAQLGKDTIHGILEKYTVSSGESIEIGDFVSLLSGYKETNNKSQLYEYRYQYVAEDICMINDNTIAFIIDDDIYQATLENHLVSNIVKIFDFYKSSLYDSSRRT